MTASVWAAPLLPGKEEAWRRIWQETMASRRRDYIASRERLGITRETAWLVSTTWGELAFICWRGPASRHVWRQILVSEKPFDQWFRRQLDQILGLSQFQSRSKTQNEQLHRWQAPAN